MARVETGLLLSLMTIVVSCATGTPAPPPAAATVPAAPRPDVDSQGGTGKRGPGDLYNACERIWCLTHERNFDLTHFLAGHSGFILHDDGSGDVFVPKNRTRGPEFPHARANAVALCGKHVHPYWLGTGSGAVTKTGYNAALGYDRSHFRTYGTRLMPCCLNAHAWGFLHASIPRDFRFGDRQGAEEMAGSGWQKAFAASRPR